MSVGAVMVMQRQELANRLRESGVEIAVDGDMLRFFCRKGPMVGEVKEALKHHKPDIVYEFHERAGILEFEGGLKRADAEELATEIVLR